jgi:two-component system, NarL family, nitrate/nitrite response regulator NarL
MVELREHAGSIGRLSRPRIVIADRDIGTRTGVRVALEGEQFVISAEEETAEGVVAAALDQPPDLCLLDADLPGGALAAAATIAANLPETRVVMMAEAARDEHVFAALDAGASGYLLKAMDPARLAPALRDVLAGGAALPRRLTGQLIDEFRARAQQGTTLLTRPGENDLTRREWDVLDCLKDGLSTRKIAKTLFISQTTVRRHVGAILKKLDVPTREAAVRAASQRSRKLNGE